MLIKFSSCLLVFFSYTLAFGQKVTEGNFHDWDYGPHSVTGNYSVAKVSGREYVNIKNNGHGVVSVTNRNPSGVMTKTTMLTFKKGIFVETQEMDQWGALTELNRIVQTGDSEYKVTSLYKGKNEYLPCKYVKCTYTGELLTELRYYSFRDKLSENEDGIAIIRYIRYDDPIRFGTEREVAFFDAEDKPVRSKRSDYHRIKKALDNKCNNVSQSYFGLQDEPTTPQGTTIAGEKFTYDDDQNQIQQEYFGLDGAITENLEGFGGSSTIYSGGYKTKDISFNRLRIPVRAAATSDSISIMQYRYDTRGNLLQQSFFDQNLNPITGPEGMHEVNYSYSAENMMVNMAFGDDFGKPTENRSGIYRFAYGRDNKGRMIQLANFDVADRPVRNSIDKVFMRKYMYDDYGRITSVSYWKDSLSRMPRWSGVFEQRTIYNEDGQPVSYLNFDEKGKLFTGEDGTTTDQLNYNADGKLAERRFLNHDSLILRSRGATNGYSIIRYGYDMYARINEITFFDNTEHPINATIDISRDAPAFQAHRIVFVYKGRRVIGQEYYESGRSEPFKVVNTLKENYVETSGISIGRKNLY